MTIEGEYLQLGSYSLFTRLGEEAVIGALFPSFHSFLSPGRSVTERFCVEEITDAISANNSSWCFSRRILFSFRKKSE